MVFSSPIPSRVASFLQSRSFHLRFVRFCSPRLVAPSCAQIYGSCSSRKGLAPFSLAPFSVAFSDFMFFAAVCMLFSLAIVLPVEELRAEGQQSSESSGTIGRSGGASIASSHQQISVTVVMEFVRWNEEAVSRCILFSSQPATLAASVRAVFTHFTCLLDQGQNAEYIVKVTFLELHNEEITYLLTPKEIPRVLVEDRQKKQLPLMEDGKGCVLTGTYFLNWPCTHWQGRTDVPCTSQYVAGISEHSAIGSSHGNEAFLDGIDLNSRYVKHLQ
ncbi:hypothetical protein RHMOL_Rhmol04G0300000 [Rhododendron molle]|uniref:Uncharacterized protein n=1 Tax=Rhododendron molle TaxID=49168 RepID=A0ACC0P758_RHOML|nr:hypothetical protein RHMOL_Rhmol04G0300000 [Rhododendron molle]